MNRDLAEKVWLFAVLILLAGFSTLARAESEPGALDIEVPEQFHRKAAKIYLPVDYNPAKKYPLIFSLHADQSNPFFQNMFFPLKGLVTQRQFILVMPFATINGKLARIWEYWEGCCDTDPRVDDVDYLTRLIDQVRKTYSVDDNKVIIAGHSGGGFMSYRMACEIPERLAAIVSFAGGTYLDMSQCRRPGPISVLQVHGSDDSIVKFAGAANHPSALQSVKNLAQIGGCDRGRYSVVRGGHVFSEKKESIKYAYENCPQGKSYELWEINKLGHVYFASPRFMEKVLDWALGQSRAF